jgi:hypothetical protein
VRGFTLRHYFWSRGDIGGAFCSSCRARAIPVPLMAICAPLLRLHDRVTEPGRCSGLHDPKLPRLLPKPAFTRMPIQLIFVLCELVHTIPWPYQSTFRYLREGGT